MVAGGTNGAIEAFSPQTLTQIEEIWHSQISLLVVFGILGAVLGLLWRRRISFEDIGWMIVAIILSMGFAAVALRVKLGM